MESSEIFTMNWNKFTDNIKSAMEECKLSEDFSDVTLVCADGKLIEAHQVFLSAGSSFFERILKIRRSPHPVVYMRGMDSSQLEDIVTFLYHGQINIQKEGL